jgi:hypothetical protein
MQAAKIDGKKHRFPFPLVGDKRSASHKHSGLGRGAAADFCFFFALFERRISGSEHHARLLYLGWKDYCTTL